MILLSKYVRIKDNYCVAYFGPCDEYVVQLLSARPSVEKELPGIRLYVACKDDTLHLAAGQPNVVGLGELRHGDGRYNFAHVRELKGDMKSHPVWDFLNESGIPIIGDSPEPPDPTVRCVICPVGISPTRSLDEKTVFELMTLAKENGYRPEVGGDVSNAGWVVGVENLPVTLAASRGVKTTLVESGPGTRLFKSLYPHVETVKF